MNLPLQKYTLRKIPKFQLIFWCVTFVAFGYFTQKLCGNCAFPQNFQTRKLPKMSVIYVVAVAVKILIAQNHLQDFNFRVEQNSAPKREKNYSTY